MICFSCGHCSQHVACPYCGAGTQPNGAIMVGFSLSDIPNPFSYAYDLGKSITAPSSSSSDSGGSGGTWDAVKSYNPFAKAYDTGYGAGDAAKGAVANLGADIRAPFDAASSALTVLKYVMIGGAVFVAVIVGYGVIRWIPVALGVASASAHQSLKLVPDIAAKALR